MDLIFDRVIHLHLGHILSENQASSGLIRNCIDHGLKGVGEGHGYDVRDETIVNKGHCKLLGSKGKF
jgi:hypothetical protein